MRMLNILVIGLLIVAATYVYKIKFDSTLQAERVGKLAGEIRREQNAIATLRAEWSKLDSPPRIEGLAQRHLPALRPVLATQFSTFDQLPDRPPQVAPSNEPLTVQGAPANEATGSVPPKGARR